MSYLVIAGKVAIFLLFSGALASCSLTLPQTYVKADEVTLPQAMKDLVCGLKTLQNESARLNLNTGTLVDQIDITLNLKASATGTSELVVNAAPTLPATVGTLGINYTDKSELIGERGNTIKITFKNLHTANLNDGGKAALKKRNIPFDLGATVLKPRDNPCEPLDLSAEDLKNATKIDSPTRR